MLLLLLFFSGLAGLVYEVLWLRQLGLILGSAARAAAVTLAVFFLGIAAGSAFWGKRAGRTRNPLALYALLEAGIGLTAAGWFVLPHLLDPLHASLLRLLGGSAPGETVVRALVAALLLFPPAWFMGGTLPVLAEQAVRSGRALGRAGSALYAANTAGGAAGVFLAGFVLPALLGMRGSTAAAIATSFAVAVVAAVLGRRQVPSAAPAENAPAARTTHPDLPVPLFVLAALSGFVTLALEVLWTRMFAQVLQNSVYSFAAILATFLSALGLGALLANRLCRTRLDPGRTLALLALLSGIAVGLTPHLFHALTGDLRYVAPRAGWTVYVGSVFGSAALVLLVPALLAGSIFPYLLKLAERSHERPGWIVGRLGAVNTLASIAGSLVAGFLLLDLFGLWASILLIAALYAIAAAALPGHAAVRGAALAAAALLVLGAANSRFSTLWLERSRGEEVLALWERHDGIVAVTRTGRDLRIRVDNFYSLGGTASRRYEETQADLPLMLQPDPRSVFFIGLGTGITAGAALRYPLQTVEVCELLPAVVEASRTHFGPHVNGLFDDPRVTVRSEDGRYCLARSPRLYDLVISDLFVPWQSGTATLYTREHFTNVRRHLVPRGLFAQWIPLYQVSRRELFIIVRTMLEVFPQVTAWRGDFLPSHPILALVGQNDGARLDPDAVVEIFRHRRGSDEVSRARILGLTGLFYAGNLTANQALFENVPLNTDDRPLIEYLSPLTQRVAATDAGAWFTGAALASWYEDLLARVPPESDPYLGRLTPTERGYFRAGATLYAGAVARRAGQIEHVRLLAARFRAEVPPDLGLAFDQQIEEASTGRNDAVDLSAP